MPGLHRIKIMDMRQVCEYPPPSLESMVSNAPSASLASTFYQTLAAFLVTALAEAPFASKTPSLFPPFHQSSAAAPSPMWETHVRDASLGSFSLPLPETVNHASVMAGP